MTHKGIILNCYLFFCYKTVQNHFWNIKLSSEMKLKHRIYWLHLKLFFFFALFVGFRALREADETHTLLQLECDKYKSVLAEMVGNDF